MEALLSGSNTSLFLLYVPFAVWIHRKGLRHHISDVESLVQLLSRETISTIVQKNAKDVLYSCKNGSILWWLELFERGSAFETFYLLCRHIGQEEPLDSFCKKVKDDCPQASTCYNPLVSTLTQDRKNLVFDVAKHVSNRSERTSA